MLGEQEIREKLQELNEAYKEYGAIEYKGNIQALEWVLQERSYLD